MKKKKEKKRIGNFDIEDNKLDKGIVISLLIILYTPSVFSWAENKLNLQDPVVRRPISA